MYEIVRYLRQAIMELQESFRTYRNILPTEIIIANVVLKLPRIFDKIKEVVSIIVSYRESLSMNTFNVHYFYDEIMAVTLLFF